jgi:hypothetical protein
VKTGELALAVGLLGGIFIGLIVVSVMLASISGTLRGIRRDRQERS